MTNPCWRLVSAPGARSNLFETGLPLLRHPPIPTGTSGCFLTEAEMQIANPLNLNRLEPAEGR